MMHRDGWDGPRASSAITYAWLVWDRHHIGAAKINRISARATATNRQPAPGRAGNQYVAPAPRRKTKMSKLKPADNLEPIVEITTPVADDPFDLAKLRLDQSFVESAGVKKLLTTVPVRKPNPQDFVRVHAGPEYREPLALINLKEDREFYLLPTPVARELPGEFTMVMLFTSINRQGVVHLWPVPLPAADGRVNNWHRSAMEAAELAMTRWIRVKANMALGAYEIFEAASTIPDPTWPELPFQELIRIAFRHRYVDRLDHAVIKRLRGA